MWLNKLLKFLAVFGTLLAVFLVFYNQEDQADFQRKSFSDNKIDMFCESWRGDYQHCLRQSLHQIIGASTPLQMTKVSKLIIRIYELDLVRSKSAADRAQVHFGFIKNYYIFIDDIHEFSFSRDQIDLFQIILFPYYRYKISQDLDHAKNIMLEFKKTISADKIPTDMRKSIKRLEESNIGVFRDVLW